MEKTKFRNQTGGFIGVIIENDAGKRVGISLAAGDGVELSEAEQQATANAPREPKDNPFISGFVDPDTGETGPALVAVDSATEVQRPIGKKAEPAAAEEGTRPDDEEVATPEAPAKRSAARKGAGAKRPPVTA